ncbi:MAG: glycosyltransferase 87 family protein [Labedaea sp.]
MLALGYLLLTRTGILGGFGFTGYLDLDVYRIGARAWWAGADLYATLPATSGGLRLPFTYPPVAAVLFAPLTLMPLPVAGALLGLLGLAATAAVLPMVAGRTPKRVPSRVLIAAVLPLAVAVEPVRATLDYGQINLVLMALVLLDCLNPAPRWPRGALVGLAAAVKLTPAAFLLFLLLNRDSRAICRAVVAFLAGTAAGFLFAGPDSVRYWTSALWDTGRIGTVHYAGNQSLLAALARFGLTPPARTVLWLLGIVLTLAVTAIGMRRAIAEGRPEYAVVLNALAILVVSPVSWTHHWVWLVPGLFVFAGIWRYAGLAVFALAPQWWWTDSTANREYDWTVGQQLLGNAYLYFALLALAASAVRPVSFGRRPDSRPRPPARSTPP